MTKEMYSRWLLPLFIGLFTLCLLTACGEDEYHYPSVKLEFLTAFSGADGTLQTVLTDEGVTYQVVEDASHMKIQANSSIRIVSNYEPASTTGGAQGVKLYATLNAISPIPVAPGKFEGGVKTDPLELQSIWMGRDYLNLLLGIKMQDGRHSLHFIEDQIDHDAATGTVTLHLRLYHDAGKDVPAYTKRAYASIPLWPYAEQGVKKVTVYFSLNTYSGGIKTYKFDYIPLQPQ